MDGAPRARAGFDAIIGNPPWEMLRADAGASADSECARPSSHRRDLVKFLRESSFYPGCDRGHVNLYQPFLDRAFTLARPGGRVGLILPWGLATDDGAASLRRALFDRMSVDTIVGIENSAALFPIHRGLRFLTLVADRPAGGAQAAREIRMRCGIRTGQEIESLPDIDEAGDESAFPIRLSRATVAAVGGPDLRIPDIRDPFDLDWMRTVADAHPRLGAPAGWDLSFGRELNASDDREHFSRTGLPVLEGKSIAPFRAMGPTAGRFISRSAAESLLPGRSFDRPRLAYRDVSGATNQRTLIAAILPAGVVTTHTLFCLRAPLPLVQQHFLCGVFNSYVLNALVRVLMGSHVTTSLVESLPVPPWQGTPLQLDIALAAEQLGASQANPVGDDSELQAWVARLYDLDSHVFGRILESFPLVPARDRQRALLRLKQLTGEA
jgi:hypothetical protein